MSTETGSFYPDTRTLTEATDDFYGNSRVQGTYPTRDELNESISTLQAAIAAAEASTGNFVTYVTNKETELNQTITEAHTELNEVVTAANTALTQQINAAKTTLDKLISDTTEEFDLALQEANDAITRLSNLETEFTAIKQQVDRTLETINLQAQLIALDVNNAQAYAEDAAEAAGRAEDALALVPAIAVDSDAVLAASRDLLGTDAAQLLQLSETI